MILSGCSWRPQEPKIETEAVYITLPNSLMADFCEFESPGDTVGNLADAYVYNTNCGRKYQKQVQEQRVYVETLKDNKNGK